MTLRKLVSSINAPARFGLLVLAGGLTLTACAYHGHGRHHGHADVELELEYRDHDRSVCCKRGRRDWWTHSRRACRHDGGEVVSRRYCRYG